LPKKLAQEICPSNLPKKLNKKLKTKLKQSPAASKPARGRRHRFNGDLAKPLTLRAINVNPRRRVGSKLSEPFEV
jgi:hypothetical protein